MQSKLGYLALSGILQAQLVRYWYIRQAVWTWGGTGKLPGWRNSQNPNAVIHSQLCVLDLKSLRVADMSALQMLPNAGVHDSNQRAWTCLELRIRMR
jgi:hypothetical protein